MKDNTITDISSLKAKHADDDRPDAPLWLLTFADVMALMLTFFVLLYSMSTLEEDKWIETTQAINKGVGSFQSEEFKQGELNDIEIARVDMRKSLSIPYIATLIKKAIADKPVLDNAMLNVYDDKLILSLPTDIIFATGGTDVNATGQRALYALTPILSHLRNRLEVVGHADPTPINSNRFATNRALSLARAVSVANTLVQSGYDRDITMKGLSSSRFNELPETLPEKERMDLSRRVDIVILKNDGFVRQKIDFE